MPDIRVLSEDGYVRTVELSMLFEAYQIGTAPYIRHVAATLRHDGEVQIVQMAGSDEMVSTFIALSAEEFDALVEARAAFLAERRRGPASTPGTQRDSWIYEDHPF